MLDSWLRAEFGSHSFREASLVECDSSSVLFLPEFFESGAGVQQTRLIRRNPF